MHVNGCSRAEPCLAILGQACGSVEPEVSLGSAVERVASLVVVGVREAPPAAAEAEGRMVVPVRAVLVAHAGPRCPVLTLRPRSPGVARIRRPLRDVVVFCFGLIFPAFLCGGG